MDNNEVTIQTEEAVPVRVSYIIDGVVVAIEDLNDISEARTDVEVVVGVGSNIGDRWDGEKFIPKPHPEPTVFPAQPNVGETTDALSSSNPWGR